jgi:hypothetical protein
MAAALSLSPILKIGPYPTPGNPRFSTPGEPGIERFGSAAGKDVPPLLGYQLPPRAVATPRSLRAFMVRGIRGPVAVVEGDASRSAAEADSSVDRYAAADSGRSFPRRWSLPVQLSESEQY